MKKFFLFLFLFFLLISGFFLRNDSICLAQRRGGGGKIGGDVFLNIDRTTVELGQAINGSVIVMMWSAPTQNNGSIDFGDGRKVNFNCPFNPDAPALPNICEFSFIHTYNTHGTHMLVLTPPLFGIADTSRIEFITVTQRVTPSGITELRSPLIATTTAEIIESAVRVIYWIVGSLLVLLIALGGFAMITAAGNPQKVNKGKKIIFYAIIGFAIMAISRGIIALILLILGVEIP